MKMFVYAICFLFILLTNKLPAEEGNAEQEKISTRDLVTVLGLKLLKMRVELDENDSGAMLSFWVESIYKDGRKTISDRTTIGLGGESQYVLFSFPKHERYAYGIFGKVNSIEGVSSLKADSEIDGAIGWEFTGAGAIPLEEKFILALRTLGSDASFVLGNMEKSLEDLQGSNFKRIDKFMVEIKLR